MGLVNVGTSTSPMDPRGHDKPSCATSILVGGYIDPRHFSLIPKNAMGRVVDHWLRKSLQAIIPKGTPQKPPSPYKTFTIFGGPKSAQETISSRSSCERHGHKATPPVPQIF